MKCYIHSEKDAVGACVSCGKFICEECKVEIHNKNHCKNCLSDVIGDKDKKIESEKKSNDEETTSKDLLKG
jgi:hypothetical protein